MDQIVGLSSAFIAAIMFGSYAVPLKLVNTYDTFAFQWFQAQGIFVIGLIVEFFVGSTRIYPYAMIGGILWSLGNLTVIPIVKTIGMGMGAMIWGVFTLITGWLCGHFGIFVDKEIPHNVWFNYLGLVITIISGVIYVFVKADPNPPRTALHLDPIDLEGEYATVQYLAEFAPILSNPKFDGSEKKTLWQKLLINKNKFLGFGLSIVAGILYGSNMIPVQYLKNKYPNQDSLEFALSHFIGIWMTSTTVLIVYSVSRLNELQINPRSVLPAIISGIIWALGQSAGFIANSNLGLTTSFPITSSGPGVVASLWAIFLFKEISGKYNITFFILAVLVTITGIGFITYSKF